MGTADKIGIISTIVIFISIMFGALCAGIADSKGRNSVGWFVVGFLSNILGLLFLLIAPPNQEELDNEGIKKGTHKKCDYCAEVVKVEAVKCPHCTADLPDITDSQEMSETEQISALNALMKPCPLCGQTIRLGSTFCPHCGRDLPAEQEQADNTGQNTNQNTDL